MQIIKDYAGVVALLVLAIMLVAGFYKGADSNNIFGSTSCASITCLSGGLRLVTGAGGDFESDVAALFASTVGITGTLTTGTVSTGALTASSIVDSGSLTQSTTNSATTTAALGCIQTTATSTVTPIRLRFFASSTLSLAGDNGAAQFVVVGQYGNCP